MSAPSVPPLVCFCPDDLQGVPALIEGNARILGNALANKGFQVTFPKASGLFRAAWIGA